LPSLIARQRSTSASGTAACAEPVTSTSARTSAGASSAVSSATIPPIAPPSRTQRSTRSADSRPRVWRDMAAIEPSGSSPPERACPGRSKASGECAFASASSVSAKKPLFAA